MNMLSFESLWTGVSLATNVTIFADMVVALLLGLLFGYERSYHGRAAGMRTYGLVCMVSAAITAVSGCPGAWFGGAPTGLGPIDPTRTVQGIVTGIGFLGAGIILKDGMKISGLTTAASIWAAAAIGILVGLGFYVVALLLTILSASFVMWGPKFETFLPTRRPVAVVIQFRRNVFPREEMVRQIAAQHGYEIAKGTISINYRQGQAEWRFVAISFSKDKGLPIADMAEKLASFDGVDSFQLSRARN